MDDFRRRPINRLHRPPRSTSAASASVSASEPTPAATPVPEPASESTPTSTLAPAPIDTPAPQVRMKKKPSKKRLLLWISGGIIGLLLVAAAAVVLWYTVQLSPVDSSQTEKISVTIESGSSPAHIADVLKEEGLIRSQTAFLWYTRLDGTQNALQAATYRLSPSESTPEIVDHLVNGQVDTFDIILYPGATLVDATNTPEDKKYDVTTALRRAGYSDAEIRAGLTADYSDYNSTLFQGRPASADLEGYVYGETYRLANGASVEDILRTSFDHFWQVIEDNNLVAEYKKHGLSLYEGITLASIIQRESGGDEDKATIAQVFYSRLDMGMPLGSDVTYQYIADKTGVARDPNLTSPYNTRKVTGLPPGPIAAPGESSLLAAAKPASTDYLYFLSGDDDVTYFARTLQEHEANISQHCQQKCQIL